MQLAASLRYDESGFSQAAKAALMTNDRGGRTGMGRCRVFQDSPTPAMSLVIFAINRALLLVLDSYRSYQSRA